MSPIQNVFKQKFNEKIQERTSNYKNVFSYLSIRTHAIKIKICLVRICWRGQIKIRKITSYVSPTYHYPPTHLLSYDPHLSYTCLYSMTLAFYSTLYNISPIHKTYTPICELFHIHRTCVASHPPTPPSATSFPPPTKTKILFPHPPLWLNS